ncbi:hypothetical protein CKM354_001228300 [Cercospora kikuchii]|uniref:Uncharacterized protein n=1 Tax=Cercospora kikuchii TaxID=84275 RepID=A0A9P3FLP4_9PEZI|nr:uncharacterized protein CKM354_001228300 [Cercospora kikuchii]GIZ49251.1 hypothetical protein CKM354_001228300 [Cercospora kikuchii]
MTDDNSNAGRAESPPRVRRSSFAGETFANLFSGGRSGSISRATSDYNGGQQSHNGAGPITSAAAQAQRRRLSLTTLGLSGSPGQASPFGSYNSRRDSYGTAGSDSIDESAIEEDDGKSPLPTPATPFARRMSFGAKALRDVRTGNAANGGGGGSPPNGTSKPSTITENDAPPTSTTNPRTHKANGSISSRTAKGPGNEGFNWSDNFRSRAERTSSIAGGTLFGNNNAGPCPPAGLKHDRSKSVAVMEPPAREMPKPKEQVRPDHFQERILKGDFYMD